MCSKRLSIALLLLFSLLVLCLFSEIGGTQITRRSLVEKSMRDLGAIKPSCSCSGPQYKPKPGHHPRPCPHPRRCPPSRLYSKRKYIKDP